MCRHCVAAALAYLDQKKSAERMKLYRGLLAESRKEHSDKEMLLAMEAYAMRRRMQKQKPEGTIELIPKLYEAGRNYYYGRKSYALTFQIQENSGRSYVLRNLSDFIEAIEKEEKYTYGKKLSFVHSKSIFTEKAWQYVQLIWDGIKVSNTGDEKLAKELPLNRMLMERFFELNLNQEIAYESFGCPYETLQIIDENPPVQLQLQKETGHAFRVWIPPLAIWKGTRSLFVRMREKVYRCTADYRYAMERLLECANEDKAIKLKIAEEDMSLFCSAVLPELEREKAIETGGVSLEKYRPKEAVFAFYLDEEDGNVTLRTECTYGEYQYDLLQQEPDSRRDLLRERQVLEVARSYIPYEDSERGLLCFAASQQDRMYQLLSTGIRQLEQEGKVYATDRIQSHHLLRTPKAQIGVSMANGLLELTVLSDAFSREELAEVLESYRRKKKYHRLRSGDFLELTGNAVTTVAELLDGMELSGKQLANDSVKLPGYRALFIDQVMKERSPQLTVKRDEAYRAVLRDMKHIKSSDFRIPGELDETMRSYQKIGYRWLRTLAKLGFGGILADEMGLGKTLQTLTWLSLPPTCRRGDASAPAARKPALIVCPTSLVRNWEAEAQKFTPEMRALVVSGADRARDFWRIDASDLVITSYALLQRDFDKAYCGRHFGAVVLDEAQHIKNRETKNAQAVKLLEADRKLVLTGTPVENSVADVWSIFDFLMPGYLGDYETFRLNYEDPIRQFGDTRTIERLKRKIAPFILRRVKKSVAKDLPEKIVKVSYCPISEDFQREYAMELAKTRREARSIVSAKGFAKSKFELLVMLMRLRQIAARAKVEPFMEQLVAAVEGGHKILVFSQFVKMLKVLSDELVRAGIPFCYLDGSTKDRLGVCNRFNRDPKMPVFLISLMAGGTGLNLTGADMVMHYDPWWNPAVEDQATDRAHRIGQKKTVYVVKMIASGTIEEKVLALQRRKQAVIQATVSTTDAQMMETLTASDLDTLLR